MANSKGESHARIDRGMVVILQYVGLEKSSKGTVIRRDAEKRYAREIEDAYQHSKFENLPSWLSNEMSPKEKIRAIINQVLGRSLEDDENFFDNGVDSQRCTRIKALLQECFGKKKLPWNVVYDCGNIEKLSKYFQDVGLNGGHETRNSAAKEEEMLRMVEKFSRRPGVNTSVFQRIQVVVSSPMKIGSISHAIQKSYLLSRHSLMQSDSHRSNRCPWCTYIAKSTLKRRCFANLLSRTSGDE